MKAILKTVGKDLKITIGGTEYAFASKEEITKVIVYVCMNSDIPSELFGDSLLKGIEIDCVTLKAPKKKTHDRFEGMKKIIHFEKVIYYKQPLKYKQHE